MKQRQRDLRERRRVVSSVAEHMANTLHEPGRVAAKLAKRWWRARYESSVLWRTVANSQPEHLRQQVEAVMAPDLAAVAGFVRGRDGGLIIALPHCGPYLYAMFRVLSAFPDRTVVCPRAKTPSAIETAVLAQAKLFCTDVRVVRSTDRLSGATLVQLLRQGAVVLIFFDLPRRFGRTRPINFLGKAAHWVAGPAQLAVQSRSLLLSISSEQRRDRVMLNVERVEDLSRQTVIADRVGEVHGLLAADAVRAVRRNPAQWLHWHLMAEFLSSP